MSEISNQNFENNGVNGTRLLGEGSSPGMCFLVQQREPGRHQVTARMKWNKELNKVAMQFFIELNRLMEKGNLLEDTDKECLKNGEREDCLNEQKNVFVTKQG